jgi:hypothetical protein
MRFLTKGEIDVLYPEIFHKVFGSYPDKQVPRSVIVQVRNEEIIGFISGYLINRDTFYVSWGGSTGGFKSVRNLWKDGELELNAAGVQWLLTTVHNEDTQVQRMLMGIGFIPRGMKMSEGKIYIEYYKDIGETDGGI